LRRTYRQAKDRAIGFIERKASEAQKAALTRARVAKFTGQMRQAELLDADAGNSASKVGELA
jgi:hypothetical protein